MLVDNNNVIVGLGSVKHPPKKTHHFFWAPRWGGGGQNLPLYRF